MKTPRLLLSLAMVSLFTTHFSRADHEIGFVEKFALATNRDEVLKELIAGTEDYYFYHALHFQNTGKQKELVALIAQWAERNEGSPLLREIKNRQALLTYETDPKATLAYLKDALHIEFNHTQQTLNPKPDLPTALDPKLIAFESFLANALRDKNHLGDLNEAGIEAVLQRKIQLSSAQRRQLISRVTRPDFAELVPLILADLKSKESRGFGEFPIHQQLLVSQLEELKKAKPDLANSTAFINAWLGKLRPNADVSLEKDSKAREAWLTQAYDFVKELPAVFNTLKAQLLYQRLVHDEKSGQRNLERFLAYLKLPRAMGYVSSKYRENQELFRHPADLNSNLQPVIGFPPFGNDEPIVRSYLLAFLAEAQDTKAFAPYIEESYLNSLFAEAKLTAGQGDAEKWFSLISPAAVQELRQRVDLDFDPANSESFSPADDVSLNVHVKNVPKLSVSIFEVNTLNYYRTNSAQIATDLNLDGLIANLTQNAEYAEAPIRRVKRTFNFPELKGRRGVWIVDLIGNGKSSRALIRKGQLHCLTRPSSAGTAITILDEALNPLPKATAIVAGQQFTADERGEIILPFSNQPGGQSVILTDGGGFAQLESLNLQGENYALSAGFHVPYESFVSGRKATVAIRPTLTVNGAPVAISLLEKVRLMVRSNNRDGTPATVTKEDFKLHESAEATYEFSVPDRLASIDFTLEGKVKSLLTGEQINLVTHGHFDVNTDSRTETTSNLFMSRVGSNYLIQQLGLTGEPRSEQPIEFSFYRSGFGNPIVVRLKTDASGSVQLGSLDGISRIAAGRSWVLPNDQFTAPGNIHIAAGETISLPWMDGDDAPDASRVSLLETRNGTFVRDALSDKTATVKTGYLVLQQLTPGDYQLRYGNPVHRISIRVTEGRRAANFLIGQSRMLETTPSSSLQIVGVSKQAETLTILVGGAGEETRVHVLASRFLPAFDAFESLGKAPGLQPLVGRQSSLKSLYVSGRTLGEEYRYVLDRRGFKKFPGSLLPRPGLLLNPWAVRETETTIDEAQKGEVFRRMVDGSMATADRAAAAKQAPQAGDSAERMGPIIPSINFLANTAPTLLNLKPDKTGKITVKLADLGDRQFIRVLAVDAADSVVRDISLTDAKTQVRDLTLRNGLDPKGHFTRQNQVTVLEKDAPYVIKDTTTTQFELSDDLGKVFNLFTSLSGNATLSEFSFLLEWPAFDQAKKTSLYSKYACHELSFFLQRKDPAFFKSVVLPYLANKRDKTFLDHYLLGDDLLRYLSAWNYGRLNTVERILLAQRHPEQAAATKRDITEFWQLITPDVPKQIHLFETMLGDLSLTGGSVDRFGLKQVIDKKSVMNSLGANFYADMPAPAPVAAAAEPASGGVGGGAPPPTSAPAKPQSKKMRSMNRALEEARDANFDNGIALSEKLEDLSKAKEADAKWAITTRGVDARKRVEEQRAQFYRKQPPTMEWAENNYYHLRISEQLAELVTVNGFWKDYAAWDGKGAFVSIHISEATQNFTEMLMALAVTDLPFPSQAKEPKSEVKDAQLTLTPTSRALLFHRELKPAEIDPQAPKLLVSQNFYRQGDRYIQEGNEKLDKFVTAEFLTGVVYGCQVVVTNPTSSTQKLDLLLQIPQGAMPVLGGKPTQNIPLTLEPYRTATQDFLFYFPLTGKFAHHPVHVSKSEKVVAFAEPFTFNVVNELTQLDTKSWDYISQFGKDADVFAFLEKNNIHAIDLEQVAWRCRDAGFYNKLIPLLSARHIYDATIWSYSVMHNDAAALREFLLEEDNFVAECGPILNSKLIVLDPIAQQRHEHLEYSPLVNARAHRLGSEPVILNGELHEQYTRLLNILAHQGTLLPNDHLAVTYYLLLQDRVAEALEFFAKVDPKAINQSLQYDYLKAVLACYQEDTATARQIATARSKESVDRWRDKFLEVIAQLDEIDGAKPEAKEEDRDQKINKLAAAEPTLDFTVESKEIRLKYRNVKDVVVNYYPMDLEFLFSTAPFVSSDTSRFSMVQPNKTERVVLPAGKDAHTIALPKEYHSSNVLVEITAAGKSTAHAYYANELNIVLSESQGRLQVLHAGDNRPLAKTYVKVFAEVNGQPQFYKDGYTDLRGKFDYLSLSTKELDQATRFSLLILSEAHGAAVKEVKPPQQ